MQGGRVTPRTEAYFDGTSERAGSAQRRRWACFNGLLCAGKTGEMVWMKEPYREGVANHSDPESCAVVRKGGGEALTGACAGWPLSREIVVTLRGADALAVRGRPHRSSRHRKRRSDPARSKTPRTHRTISHGNREIPRLPGPEGGAGRIGKAEARRR